MLFDGLTYIIQYSTYFTYKYVKQKQILAKLISKKFKVCTWGGQP